ncbi:hypothetical protein DDE74_02785 [Streptomyces lydicus]|uniref:Uncharacterized protein n=1 Tax=Streptomyces lydicus TaxID=47763 RepID=A0A3Q9K6Q2_9ACTN|nr:hypothetical protein [Streptomyces lydicus]AZS70019.1 hypothetical protein DDE74_02785 [Streptomyces lydicus]
MDRHLPVFATVVQLARALRGIPVAHRDGVGFAIVCRAGAIWSPSRAATASASASWSSSPTAARISAVSAAAFSRAA